MGQIFLMKDGTIIFGVDVDFCIGDNSLRFAEALEKYAELIRKQSLKELITGVDCLTIPCEPASDKEKDNVRPIYIGIGYVCAFCGWFYNRYKPCLHHMGLTMNIPCNCKRADEWHGKRVFNQKLPCAFCNSRLDSFSALAAHVNRVHKEVVNAVKSSLPSETQGEEMGKSIADMKQERGIGGPPMLRGQDVPKSVTSVKIKVKELREAPANFKSPAIIDLAEPVHEREAFAVNITNLRALAGLVGLDPDEADFDVLANKVKGKTFTLYLSMTNNPSSKKMVRSLFFDGESK